MQVSLALGGKMYIEMKLGDKVIITGKERQFDPKSNLIMKTGIFLRYLKPGFPMGFAQIQLDEPPKDYPSCLQGKAILHPEVLGKMS
jgi:hypothetical protein